MMGLLKFILESKLTTDTLYLMVCVTALVNAKLNRFGKGKIGRRLGELGTLILYMGLFFLFIPFVALIASKVLPNWVFEKSYALMFLALVLDDFFNGPGPRKKRFRKWAKNKLAKLKPVRLRFLPQPS